MTNRNLKRHRKLLLLGAALLLLAACGKERPHSGDDLADASRKTEKEWFWRDILAVRPEPLPPGRSDPALKEKVLEILNGLRGGPFTKARAAAERLAGMGDPLALVLSPYVTDPDRNVRWAAVAALGRLGGPRVLEPLLHALRADWEAPAILAAACLGPAGEPWIIPRLIKALGPYPIDYHPHLMVRVKAAQALLPLGNYSGVPFLIKLLKDNTPAADRSREWDENPRLAWEKEEALATLAALAGKDFGYHVDAPLREQAAAAAAFETWWLTHRADYWRKAPSLDDPLLRLFIARLIEGLASYQARNADGARYTLRLLGPPVFPFLAEAVRVGNFYERFHSLCIIARLAVLAGDRASSWAEELGPALNDRAPAVRTKAALALGCLAVPASLPLLEKALSDLDPDVRLAAVDAIGRVGGYEARILLEKLWGRTESPQMAVEIAAALFRITPFYEERFFKELLGPDASRREWALQKLIDLFGDDFSFPAYGTAEERQHALERIRREIASKPRE